MVYRALTCVNSYVIVARNNYIDDAAYISSLVCSQWRHVGNRTIYIDVRFAWGLSKQAIFYVSY